MKMTNSTYDILKHVCLIIMPLGTLIAAICTIWGIQYAEEITATAAAIDTFLGACLGISSANYTDKQYDDEEYEEYEGDEDE